jgi:hypothetical protein
MEAVAGLSLAASILQVVDFTTNVIRTGHQIYNTGSTVRNQDLALVANSFSELNDQLRLLARPDPASSGPLAKKNQVRKPNPLLRCNTNKAPRQSRI